MQDGLGWLLLTGLLAWAGHAIYQGYRNETRPNMKLVTTPQGRREPVCARCNTGMIIVAETRLSPLASALAFLFIAGGLVALLFVHALGGFAAILLGVILLAVGKTTENLLACPACGARHQPFQ